MPLQGKFLHSLNSLIKTDRSIYFEDFWSHSKTITCLVHAELEDKIKEFKGTTYKILVWQ